jgi:hypothetical protein
VDRNRSERGAVRVEMRILLVGKTGREPGYQAWHGSLFDAGVPFDAIVAMDQDSPLVIVRADGTVRYQALVLASEGVLDAVVDGEQLARAERDAGLRRLNVYAYPGPQYGLMPPMWAGRLDGITARLTARGHELFPYLKGPVPIDRGTWGYLATAEPDERFETLLAGPRGSSLLGIHCDDDGREQMVQTFDANSAQMHGRLLRQGLLTWLTREVHVGYQRNYLTVHVDDVLLPNHGWDPQRHATGTGILRMTAEDASRAARWSREKGIRLDLACNGAGSQRHALETGAQEDPLLEALLAERDAFGWINHTFEHQDLGDASQAAIEREIERNLAWATEHGIEFEPDVLITGEHTGLADLSATPPRGENRHLAPALSARGIRFLACDASRSYPSCSTEWSRSDPSCSTERDGPPRPAGTPFMTGDAFVIPRYPTVLAHDVATPGQLLDRVRHTEGAAQSWKQLVSAEARRIVAKVVGNDPRPHFSHQSNLVTDAGSDDSSESSLLSEILDAVVDLYRSLVVQSMPLIQPTMAGVGGFLLRLETWRHAWATGQVAVFREGDAVTVVNYSDHTIELPLTGTEIGECYGGVRSGWVRVASGTTVFENAAPG